MLKNWSIITTEANKPEVVVNSTVAEKPDIVSAIVYNDSVNDANIKLSLFGTTGIRAVIFNSKWSPKETVFFENFKVFFNEGDYLQIESDQVGINILVNGKA